MNIDRHNYEEYFILYMDNELSPAARRKVESFVQQHPDLKEELDILLQYKLVPDSEIVFDRKEDLLFPITEQKNALVTNANYTDWLILYIDNELTPVQKQVVDSFISQNEFAQKELDLLKRTKFSQEEIVFSDKASLYRHAEKESPRIPVRFWRAAAVLLIGIGITTAVLVNKKAPEGNIAKETPSTNKQESPLVKQNNTPVITGNETDEKINPVEFQDDLQSAPRNMAVNSPVKSKESIKSPSPEAVKQTNAIAVNENKTNNLPQPVKNPYINNNNNKPAIAANSNKPEVIKEKEALTNTLVTSDATPPLDIIPAGFPGDDDEDQPEKKNKLRGIFRKLTRTLEKRANIDATDDGNKLLVAGLSFKLK